MIIIYKYFNEAWVSVKTRLVIYAFYEQIRLFLLPILERLNRHLIL